MGNQHTGVSTRLTKAIANNSIWELTLTDPNAVDVDFSDVNDSAMFYDRSRYFTIEPLPCIPTGLKVILLFPQKRKVAHSDKLGSTLERINVEINDTINKRKNDIQVSICWTDYIFNIRGIYGNLYLQWSSDIKIYHKPGDRQMDREVKKYGGDLPILVHTDAHFKQLLFCPLYLGDDNHVTFIVADNVELLQKIGKHFKIYALDTVRPPPEPAFEKINAEEARIVRERDAIEDNQKESYLRKMTHHGRRYYHEESFDIEESSYSEYSEQQRYYPNNNNNNTPYTQDNEENIINDDGGDDNDDMSDDVAMFFEIDPNKKLDNVTQSVTDAVMSSQVASTLPHERSLDYEEYPIMNIYGDGYGVHDAHKDNVTFDPPLPSQRRRMGGIPRHIVSRKEERGTISRRIGYSPKRRGSLDDGGGTSSSADSSPVATSRLHPNNHVRPASVSKLDIDGIQPKESVESSPSTTTGSVPRLKNEPGSLEYAREGARIMVEDLTKYQETKQAEHWRGLSEIEDDDEFMRALKEEHPGWATLFENVFKQ